jgi:hypothetical protein
MKHTGVDADLGTDDRLSASKAHVCQLCSSVFYHRKGSIFMALADVIGCDALSCAALMKLELLSKVW